MAETSLEVDLAPPAPSCVKGLWLGRASSPHSPILSVLQPLLLFPRLALGLPPMGIRPSCLPQHPLEATLQQLHLAAPQPNSCSAPGLWCPDSLFALEWKHGHRPERAAGACTPGMGWRLAGGVLRWEPTARSWRASGQSLLILCTQVITQTSSVLSG